MLPPNLNHSLTPLERQECRKDRELVLKAASMPASPMKFMEREERMA